MSVACYSFQFQEKSPYGSSFQKLILDSFPTFCYLKKVTNPCILVSSFLLFLFALSQVPVDR